MKPNLWELKECKVYGRIVIIICHGNLMVIAGDNQPTSVVTKTSTS